MKHYNKLSIAAGFAALIVGCTKQEEVQPSPDHFVMTDTMLKQCTFGEATTQYAQNQIRLFGKISADNNSMAQVFPAVGGSVTSIKAELGDYVKQGQLLASVMSSEVAGFRSQTSDADADVAIAERNLQSVSDMYEGKLASEKELVTARKELQKAKAEQSRMGEINRLYRLKGSSVYNMYAPISGYVVSKDISPNEILTSSRENSVFTIAKLDNVWVVANVNESDLARIKQGQEVFIETIAYPGKKIKGQIDKIFNVIDPGTRAAKAIIKVQNPGVALKPEMNATVTVHYSESQQYVAVPSQAIVFDKSKNFVMVYKGKDSIQTREVQVYRQLDDLAYIASGLEAGEKVIVKGGLLIYDAIND